MTVFFGARIKRDGNPRRGNVNLHRRMEGYCGHGEETVGGKVGVVRYDLGVV